jgi:rubrerythrin
MTKFSRRELLYLSASLSLAVPFRALALNVDKNDPSPGYPNTISILTRAFKFEMIAHRHYIAFVKKALAEKYPNIAYMFQAFSVSEKIHADNYKRIISELGSDVNNGLMAIDVRDTKSNLVNAAEKELEKIKKTYPAFVKNLESESYEDAIINCMYSWKSHRQHEKKVREILKYSGIFFGSVARRIEGLSLDFHVCDICGATIDKAPDTPCDICNRSLSHYKKVVKLA